ncbi:MAG: phosphodiester glycosidase family protein [Clostridia bacterium]|nr:phosphodiester glycosidase family protein [Clostridia bacterium]
MRYVALLLGLGMLLLWGSAFAQESVFTDGRDVPIYDSSSEMAPLEPLESPLTLPIDFSPGYGPWQDAYIGDWEYQDPTIHVTVSRNRTEDCTYWVAEIRIQDASQLRVASADGFDSNMVMPGTALAKRVNAVIACDGDYFCYTRKGYIIRQGILYLNKIHGGRDLLLVDEDGDFHIIRKADRHDGTEVINGKKVINCFFFGPVLVEHGELGTEFRYSDMAYKEKAQRLCIAQVGKLHYKIICCEAPFRGSAGMTLKQFAQFVQSLGVDTAYNLDGGDSTMLLFRGEKVNDIENPHTRDIADIVYFASAWPGEADGKDQ